MSRLIFLTLFLFFLAGFTSAQVQSINTPGSSVAVGALITITWSYTPQTNALPGTLSIIDSTTKNTVVISNTINLATKSYQWTVSVPAGTYYLALNDGSGDKDSGTFTVFAGSNPPSSPASTSSPSNPNNPNTTSNAPTARSGAAP
ncbi:14203_t:CDS:2, partial [Cetraspora pellucida]